MSEHIIPVESDVRVGWCPVCSAPLQAHVTADVHVDDMQFAVEYANSATYSVKVHIKPQFHINRQCITLNHACKKGDPDE